MYSRKNSNIARVFVNKMLLEYDTSKYLNKLLNVSRIMFDHSVNTAYLTALILIEKKRQFELGMSDAIVRGALLHDIGKIYVPESIVEKLGPLTDTEYEVMKIHPEVGGKMLYIPSWENHGTIVSEIIKMHHERPDGSGYPNGLTEKDIPWYVQLVSAIDIYEALTAERNYGRSYTKDEAVEILEKQGFNHVIINDIAESDID